MAPYPHRYREKSCLFFSLAVCLINRQGIADLLSLPCFNLLIIYDQMISEDQNHQILLPIIGEKSGALQATAMSCLESASRKKRIKLRIGGSYCMFEQRMHGCIG